jgi:hypothetical protein
MWVTLTTEVMTDKDTGLSRILHRPNLAYSLGQAHSPRLQPNSPLKMVKPS